tara:strand:- start:392 stop:538 length:147 start_codon:yes stop_codon:yes gene_type:complete
MSHITAIVEFIVDTPILLGIMGGSILLPFVVYTYLVEKYPDADWWKEH